MNLRFLKVNLLRQHCYIYLIFLIAVWAESILVLSFPSSLSNLFNIKNVYGDYLYYVTVDPLEMRREFRYLRISMTVFRATAQRR
jgi:hypothetical protein